MTLAVSAPRIEANLFNSKLDTELEQLIAEASTVTGDDLFALVDTIAVPGETSRPVAPQPTTPGLAHRLGVFLRGLLL